MSTLLNRLKTERTGAYEHATIPVTLEQETHTGGCMRVKPQYNVYAKSIDRLIHSHGDHYQLIPYEDILKTFYSISRPIKINKILPIKSF